MMQERFWPLLILIAAIFGLVWIGQSRVLPDEAGLLNNGTAPIVGFQAPDFVLQTADGDEMQLSDLQGQPIVLNFWASWCGPCRAEMPDLQETFDQHTDSAYVIGVNQGESAETIANFAQEVNVTYPLLIDRDSSVNRAYRVAALPTTLIIDADGLIHELIPGTVNAAVLEAKLSALTP